MSEMGDDAPVESGDSGSGGSAESGTEAGEQEPADEGDGTELGEVGDGDSADDGQFVEGGDDGPAEGGRDAVADLRESGEGEPAEEGDADAPTAEAVDTGEADEGAEERSLMGEAAPAEAGKGKRPPRRSSLRSKPSRWQRVTPQVTRTRHAQTRGKANEKRPRRPTTWTTRPKTTPNRKSPPMTRTRAIAKAARTARRRRRVRPGSHRMSRCPTCRA